MTNNQNDYTVPLGSDQLVIYNDFASETNNEVTDDKEFKSLIVTYSKYTNGKLTAWRYGSMDPYINYETYSENTQLDNYNGFEKDDRMSYDEDLKSNGNRDIEDYYDLFWHADPDDPLGVNIQHNKQIAVLDNQFLAFAKYIRSPYFGRKKEPIKSIIKYLSKDPYTIYRDFKKQSRFQGGKYSKEYEMDIEMQSEITYSALKKQIAMDKAKEEEKNKDPDNLYKSLYMYFKKSNTEDFFRDPIAACVEVLEKFSAWVAEQLSLPPPDPIDRDLVIYKREDRTNYSYLSAEVKNKKVQFLISRGVEFNDSESLGYMFVNQ